jgi:uncharacterized tellurite resistance protein B-like protein
MKASIIVNDFTRPPHSMAFFRNRPCYNPHPDYKNPKQRRQFTLCRLPTADDQGTSMNDNELILRLAKVIIAAAWVDGEVTAEEVNNLKILLRRLRQTSSGRGVDLPGRDWARLEMYIEEPVGAAERARLVADLQDGLRSDADRQTVLAALRDVLAADGEVTAEEAAVLAEIETALASADVGVVGAFRRLFGNGATGATAGAAPNREQFFDDFLRNKVYYLLARRQRQGELELDLPESEQRKLGLAGGLMAKVAHIDGELTDEEKQSMAAAIQRYWSLSDAAAAFVVEVAAATINDTYDTVRMMGELAETATVAERKQFLTALFSLAAADGDLSIPEHEEIRFIARGLKLDHEDFIAAKLSATGRS